VLLWTAKGNKDNFGVCDNSWFRYGKVLRFGESNEVWGKGLRFEER